MNDGRVSYTDNRLRYVSSEEDVTRVELDWDKPRTISGMRIVTGQHAAPWPSTPITEFVVEYYDGTDYHVIPQTKTEGNETPDWHMRFNPVTTNNWSWLTLKVHLMFWKPVSPKGFPP